jgi:hypothetical protein
MQVFVLLYAENFTQFSLQLHGGMRHGGGGGDGGGNTAVGRLPNVQFFFDLL